MTDVPSTVFTQRELSQLRKTLVEASASMKTQVLVCSGTGCIAMGAHHTFEALVRETERAGLHVRVLLETCKEAKDHALVTETGCQGLCQQGPLVQILPNDICYFRVSEGDAEEVVRRTIVEGEIVERLLFHEKGNRKAARPKSRNELPFYKMQHRIALKGCGHVTPSSIDSYIAHGGFAGLVKTLEMSPDDIIAEIESAGLRGRGGGGFPTGRKWKSCRDFSKGDAFVICNGDEGDPGAFMDLSIMEGDPFRVIEGMIICAKAVHSKVGYIYVRNEYPRAVMRLSHAIAACEKRGLLGKSILGTDLEFNIQIVRGGGAFVCGESSALMRSIEGKVGEPRTKYIRSTERGLFDKPTVLNNVETFACVPWIVEHGSRSFRAVGTEGSPGTKAFCLVGKVKNTGLVEIPMGTSLRTVIYDIGGGIIGDRPFKAAQTGGPSGGCITEQGLDIGVDFDALTKAGSMMGSGGMIVMDDRTCMVDTAKYFIHFLIEESCGKCAPCREGLLQLHRLLESITEGKASIDDLGRIERLALDIRQSSLCGLGKSAPNPVLSTLKGFRDEFETHIQESRCPAGVCRSLTTFHIDEILCNGCGLCEAACPPSAVIGEKKKPHAIDQSLCIKCGACRQVCNLNAIWTSGR
jgi:NADH-quinone oxidoreductase subunit F